MLMTSYVPDVCGFSSTLSLATRSLPEYSAAISSTIGEIIRQGPHHSAQKSTSTGVSPEIRSLKFWSVAVIVFSDILLWPQGGRPPFGLQGQQPCARGGHSCASSQRSASIAAWH